MVDDDISQRADRVVEVAAVLDTKAFGHGDLDTLHVVAVPDRFEDRIGEPEIDDLLEAHLSEVVIDPIQLVFIDVLLVARRPADSPTPGRGQTAFPPPPEPPSSARLGETLSTFANRNGGISR